MRKPHLARRPPRKHEDHANHEAWAIPYADLLTLLLAFFVVMYAISSVNSGKYRVLSDSLFAAFRGAPRTMTPIQVGEKQVGSGADIQTSIVQQAMLEGQPRSILAAKADPGSSQVTGNPAVTPKVAPPVADPSPAAAAAQALQKVADQVEQAMDDLVKQDLVVVRRNDFWIEVEIKTDLLFPSGSAHLESSAVGVIERLATSLAPFPNPIRVEGYTDNVPIKTALFYSNWELSAARAGSVVRVLSSKGVDPNRLAVIGYGEQRPVQANDTAKGRNANRRVIIVILSTQLQRKTGDGQLPAATVASATTNDAGSGAQDTGTAAIAQPGELAARAAPSTQAIPGAQRGAVQQPASLSQPAPPIQRLPSALPSGTTTPTGRPAPAGLPAPAPQAIPSAPATGPATTFRHSVDPPTPRRPV